MFRCARCGEESSSRNALFRHLRASPCGVDAGVAAPDTGSGVAKSALAFAFDAARRDGCANTNFAHAERAARPRDGPRGRDKRVHDLELSKEECRALNERRRERAAKRKSQQPPAPRTAEDKAREIWVGGLVGRASTMKGFKEALWRAMPRGCAAAPPQARFLKQRGYKDNGRWVAYGFAVCRDANEANTLRVAMDRATVVVGGEAIVLKVSPATYTEPKLKQSGGVDDAASRGAKAKIILHPGEHPNPREVLLAWHTTDIEARAQSRGMSMDELIAEAVRCEHEYIELEGVRVSESSTKTLGDALLATRWPGQSHRAGVKSERYLVLKRDIRGSNDVYASLKLACEAVLAEVDADFPYDSLAITKNFISSPHLDIEDKSYQFAMAFGNFADGGELCVEARDGTKRWMINTRERLARFDGRSVHWVRGYTGTRYSVVWYVNRKTKFTPQKFDVDESFVDDCVVHEAPKCCCVQ